MKALEPEVRDRLRRMSAQRPQALVSQCALVTLACVVSFYNSTIATELVFDDLKAITENPDVTQPAQRPLSLLLANDFWGHPIRAPGSHGSYRPLTVLSFRLNFSLHGPNPWGYHVVNIALHIAVAVVFLLFLHVRLLPHEPRACTAAAALFAALPVHCDAVTSVVGRAEILRCVCVAHSECGPVFMVL